MDIAYARLMASAGVVNIDKVELHLPCETVLFEASTSKRFLKDGQYGMQLVMPRMQVQSFHLDPPSTLNHMSVETVLVALYLQIAAIRNRPSTTLLKPSEVRSTNTLEPFPRDSKIRDLIASLLLLPSKYANLFRQRHRVTAFAWNNVCIALTAELDLLEIASGREGLDSARTAMPVVMKWAQTARARRATLHAAQIIDILSSSRLGEWNISRPDLLLFQSALVLSMYLFVSKYEENDSDLPAFELRQDIDWTIIGAEGIRSTAQTAPASPSLDGPQPSELPDQARDFIRHGGPVSFSGEVLSGGGSTARKVLLNCVHLLDDIGKYRGSSYSQLLRTMSDFVIEGNH